MEQLLTPEDIEREWPFLRKGTLQQWRSRGLGPRYIKVAKRILYRRSDLEEFIDGHTTSPVSAKVRRGLRPLQETSVAG
jgi:hypothetical protein